MSDNSNTPEEENGTVPSRRKINRRRRRRRAGLTPGQWRRQRQHTRRARAQRAWERALRGWTRPGRFTRPAKERLIIVPVDDISVAMYLDTDNEDVISEVLARIDMLRTLAGYGGPERDITIQRGSIFRKSMAAVRRGISSREVTDRLAKVERAVELVALERHQAAYDRAEANAVAALLTSTRDVPRVCIRIGSILFVKYPSPGGEPEVIVRNLTQREIRALERFPEIQRRPEKTLELLAGLTDCSGTPAPPAQSAF